MRQSNPRPKKYANAAERQAAYRERNVLIEIRLDAKTADTLTRLAQDFDLPRAELATQVLKHGLLNRNWASMGPRYDLGSDTSQTGMRVVPRLRSQAMGD
jgi:hypothetical protein